MLIEDNFASIQQKTEDGEVVVGGSANYVQQDGGSGGQTEDYSPENQDSDEENEGRQLTHVLSKTDSLRDLNSFFTKEQKQQ